MKLCRILLPPILWAIAVSGCTSTAESSASVEISDSAGVRIVLSRQPRWTEDEAWSVPAEPTMTVGVMDGPEEYQLVDVAAATRRHDGTVVVVDRATRTVRLYDAGGVFLKLLGGPGSGPGEFLRPAKVSEINQDTLVVWDESAFRATLFDAEGRLLGTRPLDLGAIAKAVEPPLYPGVVEPLPDGRSLVRLVEKSGKGAPPGKFRPRSGALTVSDDSSIIDTLVFFGDAEQVTVDAPWGPYSLPAPLGRTTRITHAGDPPRICVGDQEGPEILCIDPDGSRLILRWTSERLPVTRGDVEAWQAANVLLLGEKVAEDEILRMLEPVPVPEYRPHYSQIALDKAGNLWVALGPSREAGSDLVDHLVFDPAGGLLGPVSIPAIRILEIGDNYLLGIRLDELGIEYLQMFEIRKGRTG